MDYELHGKYMVHWEDPPQFPEESEVLDFKEELVEIIPLKIQELVDRGEELILDRDEALKHVDEMKHAGKFKNEFEEWFVTFWHECKYLEYNYVQRWLKYWLHLHEIVFDTKNMKKLEHDDGRITDEEIERAKQVPIEQFYDKKFRVVGNRLIGLCPFPDHKEDTPSFTIFTDDNHFHCFGCGKHGSVIDYLILAKNMDWRDAIVSLL
jgi:hypothetical protein